MKRCPECRRDYYDDSLLYCLDDGTALLEGPAGGSAPSEETPTAILGTSSDVSSKKYVDIAETHVLTCITFVAYGPRL